MKFSINNLLSKYNLVLILSIFVGLLFIYLTSNTNSYKEHLDNSVIPVCSLLNEKNCSKNSSYCKWNSDKNICNKVNVCELLDDNHCKNSNNCKWDGVKKSCTYK